MGTLRKFLGPALASKAETYAYSFGSYNALDGNFHHYLEGCFDWNSTPEGADFWSAINDQYKQWLDAGCPLAADFHAEYTK